MALIQRPRFYEGQILGSTDLTAGLEYARSQEARHDRAVHSWGIADGLVLVATPQASATASYVAVSLTAGLAFDGTGREVLVPDQVHLDEKLFIRSNVAVGDPSVLYPVLLAGADTPALAQPTSHACTSAQASRTVESYKLSFGAPGAELALAGQVAPSIDQGAGGGVHQSRWWLLVGYVQWDATQARFTAISDTANGVTRHYVGVRADEVTAQGGTLVARARRAGTAKAPVAALAQTPTGGSLSLGVDDGHGGIVPSLVAYTDGTVESDVGTLTLRSGVPLVIGKPMLRLAETPAGGTLTFGLQTTGPQPSQLMQVDEHGNLTIAGVFNGLHGGAVKVASGVATDGVILPLPDGITDDQLASGLVDLHVVVTPRPPGRAPYDADLANFPIWIGTPISATVDADRRLRCLIQWVGFRGAADLVEVLGGAADYVMFAVVKGATP